MTYRDYRTLRETIEEKGFAVFNGRSAYDEDGLRFIATAEGLPVQDPAEEDDDDETPADEDDSGDGGTVPPPVETDPDQPDPSGPKTSDDDPVPPPAPDSTPADADKAQESNPGATAAPSYVTPSGLNALSARLAGLNKGQLQEIGTFLGMEDVDATNDDLRAAIEVLRAVIGGAA